MFTAFFMKLTAFIQALIMAAALWLTPLPKNAVTFSFVANPSTGYTWVCEQNPEGIVEIADEYYMQKITFNPQPGTPGTYKFVVAPVADGETTLTFYYMRVWEGKDSAVEIINYDISVVNGIIDVSEPVYG